MSDIYPISVDNDEMQDLFNVINQYSDTIISMAKLVGGNAAADYDRAGKIINKLLDKVENAVSPPQCLAKECIKSDYCYMPSQCQFVSLLKNGFAVARSDEKTLQSYLSLGWKIISVDDGLKPTAKKYLLYHEKSQG